MNEEMDQSMSKQKVKQIENNNRWTYDKYISDWISSSWQSLWIGNS